MAVELKMPALSPTMEEGTLAKWLVKEGDRVGVRTELVRAPSWNIKVTTPDDWAMARAIEDGLRPLG